MGTGTTVGEHRRIGLNLLKKRRDLKMTQKELSEVSDLSRYKISRMERGRLSRIRITNTNPALMR